MVPDDAFLRRLPVFLNGTQAVQLEALLFSADVIDASFDTIRRIATSYQKGICQAPRSVHVTLFTHAWTIIDCIHVVRQVLAALDYQTPLAVTFIKKYESAYKLRNKMDHLTGNAKNTANSNGRPPLFGALAYVCVPEEQFVVNEGEINVTGGGMVMLSSGRFLGGQKITAVNPAGLNLCGPVGGFRLEAFDEHIELEQAVRDLQVLMVEVNDRLEKDITKLAEALSKERGVPVETLLANAPAGLSFYLAFESGDKS